MTPRRSRKAWASLSTLYAAAKAAFWRCNGHLTTVKSLLRLPHPAACTINGWHNRECDAQLGAGSKRGLGSGL